MMLEELTNNNMLSDLKDMNQEFLQAQTVLSSHVYNKDNYRTNQYKIFSGSLIKKNYDSQNQRRSYFFECEFNNASFKNCGLTGSYFVNCTFKNCNMDFAIFDNCIFVNCIIEFNEQTEVMAASFCDSIFSNSTIKYCYFHSCSLTRIDVHGTSFNDCYMDDIIWEGSKFVDCSFNNIILENLNMEFVYIDNVTFNNTILPFASLPFAFKGIEYVINTTDDIKISSMIKSEGLSREEYVNLLPQFVNFYKYTNNYFPLANILIARNEMEQAFEVIKKAVFFLTKIHEYRTLKYFSILMRISDFTDRQKIEIYRLINNEFNKISDNQSSYATKYLYEIRDNLLNNRDDAYVTFEIDTNITSDNIINLNNFINKLELLFRNLSLSEKHYIEFRHNSPYQFFITAFADPESIILIISATYMALRGINKFYNVLLDNKQKKLNIKKTQLEINEMENIAHDYDKKFVEQIKSQKDKSSEIYNQLSDASIQVNYMNHNVYNTIINISNSNFQQYSTEQNI